MSYLYKNINGGGVNVVRIDGDNYYEIGCNYGLTMQSKLLSTKKLLIDAFSKYGITYNQLVDKAQYFYQRYSDEMKPILSGISSCANLSMDDVNILNGMETLNSLISSSNHKKDKESDIVNCAFVFIPEEKTVDGKSYIARNYDFPPDIYGEIAKDLTVTLINLKNSVNPVAIVGMPGQIYCPSCIGKNGVFLELNNGMPSGGYYLNQSSPSMLTEMFLSLQKSSTIEDLSTNLMQVPSDYSLIVSFASSKNTITLEFSSNYTLGMRPYYPKSGDFSFYTNFYLNSSWGSEVQLPTDATTWMGVTRRDNLKKSFESEKNINLSKIQNLMSKTIEDGGAFWSPTIYQLIFELDTNILYARRSFAYDEGWAKIELNEYFSNEVCQS